jgi:ABC-2 type transport system permease protein
VALLLCLALTAASIGIFLGGLVRTPEQAGAIAWIVPLFLGAIGGCWWPLEIVPRWMQIFGHVSPAAWAMDALHGMLSFGKGPGVIVVPCLVLLGYAAVFISVGARSLKTE